MNAPRPLAIALALALALRLAHAEPIPFDVATLQDKGGQVEIDFQLLLPPPGNEAYERLRTRLLEAFFPDEPHPAATPPRVLLAKTQAALLKDFDESYGGQASPTPQRWRDTRRQRVFFEAPSLLVVEQVTESYLGGAHENRQTDYLIFDPHHGRELVMSDLFHPGAEDELTNRIKDAIRARMRIGERGDLNQAGFWEKDIRPQNLFVGKDGIGFHFNAYEIAPYAMGETVVRIEWAQVRPLLKPDSPLAPLAAPAP